MSTAKELGERIKQWHNDFIEWFRDMELPMDDRVGRLFDRIDAIEREALAPADPARQALNDALIVCHLSPIKDGESAGDALQRLISWHVEVALDPRVSDRSPAEQAPLPPVGWKLVPMEPTAEMLDAAHEGDRAYTLRNFGDIMTVQQGPYDHWKAMLAASPTQPASAPAREGATLRQRLQQRCSDWGVYWRASDAHGVDLSHEQALDLLRDALDVEVEIAAPAAPAQPREAQAQAGGARERYFVLREAYAVASEDEFFKAREELLRPEITPRDAFVSGFVRGFDAMDAALSTPPAPRAPSIARLLDLIDDYWGIAYKEGKDGRTRDNETNDAGRKWNEIRVEACRLASLAVPASAGVEEFPLPECFKRLFEHAYGMTFGTDWNKGTAAGHHRQKLIDAVAECRSYSTPLSTFVHATDAERERVGEQVAARAIAEQRKAILVEEFPLPAPDVPNTRLSFAEAYSGGSYSAKAVRNILRSYSASLGLQERGRANLGVIIDRDGDEGRFVCAVTEGHTPFIGDKVFALIPKEREL